MSYKFESTTDEKQIVMIIEGNDQTWMELLEDFKDFLRANGYAIDEKDWKAAE